MSEKGAYGMPNFAVVKDKTPIVMTTHGAVRGQNRRGVAVFRGIPYGHECGGINRFLPPLPAENWQDVKDCTRNGSVAMQYDGSISGIPGLSHYFSGCRPEELGIRDEYFSEDCLVLNVLTPGLDDKKRPVVVYIHGGGFTNGSGSLFLGADDWAREQDIVLVSVNHRLNVFGYLYLGAYSDKYAESGTAGMMDLILALEWVRDNIAAFGGDKNEVTIMGESGGGSKVSHLLAMEKARGLFKRAIVESGSAIAGKRSKEEAAETTRKLLKNLNLEERDWERLLHLPADVILKGAFSEGLSHEFAPCGDDINLNYQAENKFVAPEISKDVSLLVGCTEDEIAVTLDDTELSWEDISRKLVSEHPVLAFCEIPKENADKIVEIFRNADTKNDSPNQIYAKILSTLGFGRFAWQQAYSKAIQGGAPVYQYVLSYDCPRENFKTRYSWHTCELPLQCRVVYYKELEEFSKKLSSVWAAFIRTGNPSIEGQVWPPYTSDIRQVMVIDEIWHLEEDPVGKILKNVDAL